MAYRVKEIFHTLQGEGAHSGRAAVFCRFVGCNLWSGREGDRAAAVCGFCDTDFRNTDGPGGGVFAGPDALADAVAACWAAAVADDGGAPYVVCTGGEPLLQLDAPLIVALHARGLTIAVETNGTQAAPDGLDWICVSPKAGAPLRLTRGDELKLVWPQAGLDPRDFSGFGFSHFFLQPLDGADAAANLAACVAYCRAHPLWRLSLQSHKLIGIP